MTVNWDIVLKIWAVVGPLIAGGASAVWARRNQLQDRKYDVDQHKTTRDQLLQDRELDFKFQSIASRRTELRLALTQFVAASNDYITICQNNATIHANADTKRLELETLARLNLNYLTVSIIGTADIALLAVDVLNIATDFPHRAPNFSEAELVECRDKYLYAKNRLSSSARKFFGIESEA